MREVHRRRLILRSGEPFSGRLPSPSFTPGGGFENVSLISSSLPSIAVRLLIAGAATLARCRRNYDASSAMTFGFLLLLLSFAPFRRRRAAFVAWCLRPKIKLPFCS